MFRSRSAVAWEGAVYWQKKVEAGYSNKTKTPQGKVLSLTHEKGIGLHVKGCKQPNNFSFGLRWRQFTIRY